MRRVSIDVETLLAAGARLTFYPVRDGMRNDPADVIAAITPGTRAIVVIHDTGFSGPIHEIESMYRQRNLCLIEDCSLALLSTVDDRPRRMPRPSSRPLRRGRSRTRRSRSTPRTCGG